MIEKLKNTYKLKQGQREMLETPQARLIRLQEQYAQLFLAFEMTLQRLEECKEACESLSKHS